MKSDLSLEVPQARPNGAVRRLQKVRRLRAALWRVAEGPAARARTSAQRLAVGPWRRGSERRGRERNRPPQRTRPATVQRNIRWRGSCASNRAASPCRHAPPRGRGQARRRHRAQSRTRRRPAKASSPRAPPRAGTARRQARTWSASAAGVAWARPTPPWLTNLWRSWSARTALLCRCRSRVLGHPEPLLGGREHFLE